MKKLFLSIVIIIASTYLYAQENLIESVESDRIIDTAAFRTFKITEAFYLTEKDTFDLNDSENKDPFYLIMMQNLGTDSTMISIEKNQDYIFLIGVIKYSHTLKTETDRNDYYNGFVFSAITKEKQNAGYAFSKIPGSIEKTGKQYYSLWIWGTDNNSFFFNFREVIP
jgi:hypothetical protein